MSFRRYNIQALSATREVPCGVVYGSEMVSMQDMRFVFVGRVDA